MRNLILILMMVVMFISCKKETAKISLGTTLSGKWDWISSSGGIAGMKYTPASTGNRIIDEFTNDSIYRTYRNGTLTFENKYHIIKSRSFFKSDSTSIIIIDGRPIRHSYEIIHADTLILIDECFDCYWSWYRRIE